MWYINIYYDNKAINDNDADNANDDDAANNNDNDVKNTNIVICLFTFNNIIITFIIIIIFIYFLSLSLSRCSSVAGPIGEAPLSSLQTKRRFSDSWKIAEDDLYLQSFLGVGAFGEVWKAMLKLTDEIKPGNREVAVKTLKGKWEGPQGKRGGKKHSAKQRKWIP